MSIPAFAIPPLPLGWTEHTGPNGQPYYFNNHTQESTYTRPIPALPLPVTQVATKKKKEKPLVKTAIPGTDWIRVKTTEGNVFYSHKVKKESIWRVPEEIAEAVSTLEAEERKRKDEEARMQVDEENMAEVERVRGEMKKELKQSGKRKVQADVSMEEVVVVSKKARVEEEEEDEEEEEESEEEDWQREAAAQLAQEEEEEKVRLKEEAERANAEAKEAARKAKVAPLTMPARVEISIEEGKALFKTLLREKDINPLHPWDTCLPLFISDPRYVLLPSVSVRREAFDEYCRDKARELRQSAVKKEKEAANPKDEFEKLLKEEVKSTRASWSDFRKAWKKDRRFWGWGRDEREREKRFREFVRELGEQKRAAAQRAEVEFFALLKQCGLAVPGSTWKEVKRNIDKDPSYDAVGSSSLREELFNTFLKASHDLPAPTHPDSDAMAVEGAEPEPEVDEAERARRQQEKKDRAVKEREQKVKSDRSRIEADMARSKQGLDKEEGEMQFRTLLVDAVRDPQISWDAALPQLNTDPRFTHSLLPRNHQLHLFYTHVEQLRARQMVGLHALFETNAPSLATEYMALPVDDLLDSVPAVKLGLSDRSLQHEFDKWQRERNHLARGAFDEMMSENAFVEFWGRLGKIGGEGVDGGVKADETEEDEGEGGGGKVDMKALAKNVDVQEIEKVLKNDKRYINFDHVPEQRERWIRDYLSRLSAPKLSVHSLTS